MNWTTKEIRKVAFAVGVGFTVGKNVGCVLDAALDGVIKGIIRSMAKEGNEFAQTVCKKANLSYEKESDNEPKVKMGFHY